MPHRIFEQSRQRTWQAMGREKEDREKDRVSDGQRERERNIIRLLYLKVQHEEQMQTLHMFFFPRG